MKSFLLLTTGGTIDSDAYPEDESQYPADTIPTKTKNSAMNFLAALAASHGLKLDWTPICNKDSKAFNADDQKSLQAAIDKAEAYERVIVTSGTDRMTNIALALGPGVQVPVVFTGAIWPLANAQKSDGPANLRQALLGRPELVPGVYIAMGDVFAPASRVRKNFEKKRFELIS